MLKLNCIMLNSDDPKTLGAFYGEVLEKKPDMDENSFIGYQAGDSFLTVGPHDKVKGKAQQPERILFFFETKDVEAEFKRIKEIKGATVIQEPYDPTGGDMIGLATLADPDGNYFQLSKPWDE